MNGDQNKKPDNTPRGQALRLVDELREIVKHPGAILESDILAFDAFYERLEAQPEPVRFLFAFELQHRMNNDIQAFQQADKKQLGLMSMGLPQDIQFYKRNAEFIRKTLASDESFRIQFARKAMRNLPDKHILNPVELTKIFSSEKCPDYIRASNVSDPVSKSP